MEGRSAPVALGPLNGSLSLTGFELSLDTAPLEALERAAQTIDLESVQEWCSESSHVEEAALLLTCHRVEIVVAATSPADPGEWFARLPGEPAHWRRRDGRALVEHVFEVAFGRRSIAVGERDIQTQVLGAARTTWSRHPRPLVRELLRSAAAAAEAASPSAVNAASTSAMAARLVESRVDPASGAVVVIGAGAAGRQAAELLSARFNVTIVYRTRPPDPSFLERVGARAVPTERRAGAIAGAAAIVAAASSPSHFLSADELPRGRPMVLVDLGVPRNIDPAVREIEGAELHDLADLLRNRDRPADDEAAESAVRRGAEAYWSRFESLALETWIDEFRRSVEELRQAELRRGRPYLGALDPEQERALDLLTRRLVDRILHAPTDRLRNLPAGADGEAARRLAVALLRPADPEP